MTPIFATVDYYILAFSAITVVVTIWMGFRSAKTSKTASDFFVAGRSVSVGWNASAISGEYLSAASFMGIAGMVMSSGYDALWYPVCYACGYLFLLLFIAGPLRRFGAYTIPDFAEGRYDSPLFRKIAVCFVLFIGFFYTMPQMKGAGTTLAYIFPGLPYWAGVVLVGAVITLNVALGGMKGITLVQAFQYWAKMFAISVPIFVLMAVYGHYGKQLSLNGTPAGNLVMGGKTYNFHEFSTSPDAPTQPPIPLPQSQIAKTPIDRAVTNLTYLLSRAEESYKQRKPKLKPGGSEIGAISLNDAQLKIVVSSYERFSGRSVIQTEVRLPEIKLNLQMLEATVDQILASLEASLNTNGIVLLPVGEALSVITTQEESDGLSAYLKEFGATSLSRKPLPEKAPADSTWLSPFGPLTTKAAKALSPTYDYTGEMESSSVWSRGDGLIGTVKVLTDKAKLGAINFPDGSYKVEQLVEYYAVLWPFTNPLNLKSEVKVEWSKSLSQVQISWTSNGVYSSSELLKVIVAALRTNGVTLIHDGENKVKVFPTKDAILRPVDTRPYALLYTYSLIIALICGTAGLPHILVRFYTNPDGGAAKRTTMWVMILIGIFYVFPPVFGVMGRNLFPELYNGIGAKGTDKIVLELPRLLNEKYAPLGSILSGITCAGAFAAFMSTFSGLLVSMTGALAHDVYGRMLRPKSTPEQRMRMFKFAAVLIGFVSILLGSLVEPLEINFMVGQAFAIAAASYFPLLFMSVWWRGMTMRGAAVGMLTGGLCALIAATLTNVSNLALDKGPMGKIFSGFAGMNDFWAHHPLLRILCEQPAIWTVPLAITLMIVVSKATRKDVPSDVRMKMLVLHAPEKLGLKQEYIQEHQGGGH